MKEKSWKDSVSGCAGFKVDDSVGIFSFFIIDIWMVKLSDIMMESLKALSGTVLVWQAQN